MAQSLRQLKVMTGPPSLLGPAALLGLLVAAGCDPGVISVENQMADARAVVDAAAPEPDASEDAADGPETMTITYTTSIISTQYDPTNIVASWIEDDQGAFVQTINIQAGVRKQYLRAWNSASGGDESDALTGATRQTHNAPVVVTWDVALAAVPDGVYTIRLETCDMNSGSAADNNQGSFPFTKDGNAAVQNLSGNGYLNVTVDYSGR
jgi:hypothetical protein